MVRRHVPAMTLAVVDHHKIVRLSAYGLANLEWKARTTNDTRFEIASISKMFTGAALRVLIDQGKVSPHDLVSKYVAGLPDKWRSLTVQHLISMSMGIGDDWGTPLIPYSADVTTSYTDESSLQAFAGMPSLSPIGTEFHYCSPAYALLGQIVSKVAHKPLSEFIAEHLFRPAGMTESSFIDDRAVVPQRAEGYLVQGARNLRGWYLGQYLHSRPDVGILSTAKDLAKWIIALERNKIVKNSTELWQGPVGDNGTPLDYSYGWFISTQFGHRKLYHSGGFRTGFHTLVTRFPDDDVSVILFSNTDSSELSYLAAQIAAKYAPAIPDPDVVQRQRDSDPSDTRECINILKEAAAGRTDAPILTPDAFAPLAKSDIKDFFAGSDHMRFAGRKRLRKPLIVHGHKLLRYTTLAFTVGGGHHMISFFRDEQGRIAYIEPTT